MKSGSRRVILVYVCILKDHVTVFIVGSDQTDSNWPPSRTALIFCSMEILQPNKMSDIWTFHTARRCHCCCTQFSWQFMPHQGDEYKSVTDFPAIKNSDKLNTVLVACNLSMPMNMCSWWCLQLTKMQKSDSLSYIFLFLASCSFHKLVLYLFTS